MRGDSLFFICWYILLMRNLAVLLSSPLVHCEISIHRYFNYSILVFIMNLAVFMSRRKTFIFLLSFFFWANCPLFWIMFLLFSRWGKQRRNINTRAVFGQTMITLTSIYPVYGMHIFQSNIYIHRAAHFL